VAKGDAPDNSQELVKNWSMTVVVNCDGVSCTNTRKKRNGGGWASPGVMLLLSMDDSAIHLLLTVLTVLTLKLTVIGVIGVIGVFGVFD
jgi:hypothetical protein